jgi:glutathione S-transferase
MPKLYFSPGACSLSPHIALREAGLSFEMEQVDLAKKTTKSGGDFLKVNAKGQVPTLVLDSGETLTEGPAIVQYIADQAPKAGLAPANGTHARYHLQEWLNFVTSELHKGFSPLFGATTPDAYKQIVKDRLATRFDILEKHLAGNKYLLGDQFSVADGYAFTILGWGKYHNIDYAKWPNMQAYIDRIAARPKVQEALKAEGLVK